MIDAIDAQIAPLEDANHLALSGRVKAVEVV
jgi:hypothetical protein